MACVEFPAGLYVAATPIGRLSDITERVRQALASCDVLYAEDTRRALQLLSALGIKRPSLGIHALHNHNEQQAASQAIEHIKQGHCAVLISDAGTPGVSDPGAVLVDQAWKAGVVVCPLPGASAVTALLSVCGFARWPVCFHGFAPAKPAGRRSWLGAVLDHGGIAIIFEAPHRAEESLADCAQVFGEDTPMTAGRELTKQFETIVRGTISEVQSQLHAQAQNDPASLKGEMVWAFDLGEKKPQAADAKTLAAWATSLGPEMPKAKAARILVKMLGIGRDQAYEALMKSDDSSQ